MKNVNCLENEENTTQTEKKLRIKYPTIVLIRG